MKKKSHLKKYIRRCPNSIPANRVNGECLGKRKRQKTPKKASYTAYKSPFKSPLYHPISASPFVKKFKSSRTLFSNPCSLSQCDKNTNDDLWVDIEDNVTEDIEFEGFEPFPEDHQPFPDDKTCYDTHEESSDQMSQENQSKLLNLAPLVLNELAKHDGLDTALVSFFELVANKQFPLDNISFLLWIEVVKWFSCVSTTQMRYTDETKLFWKLGWRLFGKRFVNFMGGFKSHGDTVLKMAEVGKYSPGTSEINFAVPDINILREFDPYAVEIERKPGIFTDTIREMSESLHDKSACITFDGKKIKQGLTDDTGDVDLLGFEKGVKLQERKDMLNREISEVKLLI